MTETGNAVQFFSAWIPGQEKSCAAVAVHFFLKNRGEQKQGRALSAPLIPQTIQAGMFGPGLIREGFGENLADEGIHDLFQLFPGLELSHVLDLLIFRIGVQENLKG